MKRTHTQLNLALDRRAFLVRAAGLVGASAGAFLPLRAAETPVQAEPRHARPSGEADSGAKSQPKPAQPMIGAGEKLKITKVETRLIKPRWLFLKIHTDAGIAGLGEPILEGRAKTCAMAVEEPINCQEQVSLGKGYLKQPFTVSDGFIDIPTGPGLGTELDKDALADKIDHDWRNPESYDTDDGSVVDWQGPADRVTPQHPNVARKLSSTSSHLTPRSFSKRGQPRWVLLT